MFNDSKVEKLISQEELLMESLYNYYKDSKIIEKVIPIITGKSIISCGAIDHFVTDYSKKHNISYFLVKNGEKILYYPHKDYKNHLDQYTKRFLDVFCRQNEKNNTRRLAYNYDGDKCIITTISQLNFFRWALNNNIIDYVEKNLSVINKDLNAKRNRKKTRTKKAVYKPVFITPCKNSTIVSFD